MNPGLLFGLIGTPFLIAVGQILFKKASEDVGDLSFQNLAGLMTNTYLLLALIIYGLGTLIWVFILKSVPVSYAYLFMASTFIVVPVLAALFLGETVSLRQVLGTIVIITGIVLAAS